MLRSFPTRHDNSQKTLWLQMYSSFMNLPEEESTHLLLDMDSLVPKRSNFLGSRGCEPAKKKCSLGNIWNKQNKKHIKFDFRDNPIPIPIR